MKKLQFTALSVAMASLLSACGGDDDTTYTVGGTATGISSPIEVNATDGSQTYNVNISQDGSFEFSDSFAKSTELTLSLEEPRGNSCTLSQGTITVSSNISGIELNCDQFGSIQGVVTDYQTGEVIAGASLSFSISTEDGKEVIKTAETSDDGSYEVTELGYESNIIVKSVASEYIPRTENIEITEADSERRLSISLKTAETSVAFSGSEGATINSDESELSVSIESGSLVDSEGNVVSGDINAVAANVDASSDRKVLPGTFRVANNDGTSTSLEVYGAITVDFYDETGGELNLIEGSRSTIDIPVSQLVRRGTPKQSVTLMSLDEDTGNWVAEGGAELVTGDNGEQMYRAEVNHFSTWAVGDTFESIPVTGCVENSGEEGSFSTMTVVLSGDDYIGADEAEINEDGSFELEARPDSSVLINVGGDEAQSNTVVLNVGQDGYNMTECLNASDDTMTVKLTWGDNPRDLDSHFNGPASAEDDTQRFHIFFGSKQAQVGENEVFLDVDDITSFGPEIITIPDFIVAGEYNYFVHHFSGESNIEASPTRVEVNYKGERLIFAPTESMETVGVDVYDDQNEEHLSAWQPFKLVVDESGEVQLIEVNEYLHFDVDALFNGTSLTTNGAASTRTKSLNDRFTK